MRKHDTQKHVSSCSTSHPEMAEAHIVEFAVFQSVDEATIKNRAAAAAKVTGLVGQYAGSKIEDAGASVHVTGGWLPC